MDDFKDKTILITGGTGSFGNKLARKLIKNSQFKKIVIASRDEKKQHEMRLELGDEKLEYKIADVRDRERINEVMRGIDYVFHSQHLNMCQHVNMIPMKQLKQILLVLIMYFLLQLTIELSGFWL